MEPNNHSLYTIPLENDLIPLPDIRNELFRPKMLPDYPVLDKAVKVYGDQKDRQTALKEWADAKWAGTKKQEDVELLPDKGDGLLEMLIATEKAEALVKKLTKEGKPMPSRQNNVDK